MNAPGPGHNSGAVHAGKLQSFVERIERLNEEKAALAEDQKLVYQEAKSEGYDTKALRRVVALRKMDKEARLEQQEILETYGRALGLEIFL